MAQRNDRTLEFAAHDGERGLNDHTVEGIRRRFWRAVAHIRMRNAAVDPDDILRDVTEAVEEVRAERYEEARRAPGGR